MDEKQHTITMNIAVPESMKDFVHEEVTAGGYASVSEFIRQLIRDAQQRKAAETELESLLLDGLRSGKPLELTPDYWARKRRRLFPNGVTKNKVR
jgi:antitoxin ParD1/3/4